MVVRWSRVIDKWLVIDELEESSKSFRIMKGTIKVGYFFFKEFCKFLEKEVRILCNFVIFL